MQRARFSSDKGRDSEGSRKPADQGTRSLGQTGPVPAGTVFFLGVLLFAGLTDYGATPTVVARYAAVVVFIGVIGTVLADCRRGIKNLGRPDLLALIALYFLTLFEFLFHQSEFDFLTDSPTTRTAVAACLWGFAGLSVGRHLVFIRKQPLKDLLQFSLRPSLVILVFWACFFAGFGYMLACVSFNPIELIRNFMGARFSQPWARGRFGDWKALLYETSMIIYLVPPLAGIIAARRGKYTRLQRYPVVVALFFVLFFGFTGGTRNIFATYLLTFLIGYAFSSGFERKKELIVMSIAAGLLMVGATTWMLQFRDIGFQDYLEEGAANFGRSEHAMSVDYNLYTICRLVDYFPKHHPYLGWEMPYQAIIRPIPRALWPGKPEGLSITIEEIFDVEGLTLSASFIGEAYMSGGLPAVFLTGIVFGILTRWLGFLGSPQNSEFGILIYSSGFFAAIITMRSIFVITTALMPTLIAGAATYIIVLFHSRASRPARRPV